MPEPISTFEGLDLGAAVNKNVQRCKFKKPTPVQKYAIPAALAGRDLMACAQTGSGKTAAFCFPIIAGILRRGLQGGHMNRKTYPLALVLSPTRELASQIHDESRKFAYQTGVASCVIYGGAPAVEQFRAMERGCDLLIATPGRLIDLIDRAKISLSRVMYLALDEADRMLDMGFEPQIRQIVDERDMPPRGERQTMLFSATFPREIQRMASDFLDDYIFLTVGRVGSSHALISQTVERVNSYHEKSEMLLDLVESIPGLTLVFVETKRGADQLEDFLYQNGKPATSIHGDRTQQEREAALSRSAPAKLRFSSRRTSRLEAWTSRMSRTSSISICRLTSMITRTASVVPVAQVRRVKPPRSSWSPRMVPSLAHSSSSCPRRTKKFRPG